LANGYLLQGEVSDARREALTKLAAEFTEDYYEFEGTPTEVAVYWEESGGVSEARHMHEILQSLAGL
jgi:recombinational DNA repair ATPase RecF